MPALEALNDRFRAAHTLVCGISIDTTYCHAAWAEQLGGISFPLISDFHPKGEIATSMGVYLADKGMTDRATILIDAAGTVRYTQSVTPAGVRDVLALVDKCESIDAEWGTRLPNSAPPQGLEPSTTLYVRDNCMPSRWAMYARRNLHLEESLPVRNVSHDADAMDELERLGGKGQAPALVVGNQVLYESAEIAAYLCSRACRILP